MTTANDSEKASTAPTFAPPSSAAAAKGTPSSRFSESVLGKLGVLLTRTIEDAAALEVKTYTSTSADATLADVDDPLTHNTRLRAFTRISLDGDTEHCVPMRDGEIDKVLWEVHLGMVKQAQELRDRTLATIVAAVQALRGHG